ncbi:MAG: tRNA lysidine(34) synthetase TilS [Gemmatimonadetes bacterium]|nr:tRNA lysidine(34) synthetase TilS [Gemmatimonadota bacterium]
MDAGPYAHATTHAAPHSASLTPSEADDALLRASLEVALRHVDTPLVLAVSGGRDSMALLHAMAAWAPERVAAVATFDHGTGPHATEAASLVAAQARRLGLTVVRERARSAPAVPATEAAWRAARWAFLRRVARGFRARVATAHTRDDQLETVVMRLLRGTGARGLAALAATSPVVRPFLALSRDELAQWVASRHIDWVEDPANREVRFLRTRVRFDLLPALESASPGVGSDLLALAERAAAWRRDLDAWLDRAGLWVDDERGRATLPAAVIEETNAAGRAVVWAALSARAGVVLDARGTRALERFTTARRGAAVPLAGGASVLRRASDASSDGGSHGGGDRGPAHDVFEVRRRTDEAPSAWQGAADALPLRLGAWRFRRLAASPSSTPDAWVLGLPATARVVVRAWEAGDRIRTTGAPAGRRVARYLSEARVPALDRPRWPVVLVDDEVAWVPGVCRSGAAPPRSGRPALIWYRCERARE